MAFNRTVSTASFVESQEAESARSMFASVVVTHARIARFLSLSRDGGYDLPVTEQMVGASVDDLLRGQQEEIDRLGLLVGAAGRLLATLDLEEVLPQVLGLAKQTLTADGYSLWRRRPTGEWFLQTADGLSEEYVAASQDAIANNDAEVSLDAPIVAGDIAATPWLTDVHKRAHAAEGTKAFLAMPLNHQGQVIGTLVFYYRATRAFSDAELASVTAVANLAAAAIGTAAIYATQAQLAEDRRLIAEASELLGSSLDYEATLAHVAQLVVPTFADWCSIDMLAADGSIQRLATAHADPAKVQLAKDLADVMPEPDIDAPTGVPKVIRTQQPELYSEITEEMVVEALADQPQVLEAILALGLVSSMTVPLVARGRALGAISFVAAESGRRYTEADLAIATDLARRAAVAVDNALLYRDAIQNEQQVSFLAEAGTVLSASLDRNDTLAALARLAVPQVADWCIVDVVDGADIKRIAVASAHADQQAALEDLRVNYPPTWDSPQPAARALREGIAVIIESFDDDRLHETVVDERHFELMRTLSPQSAVAIPLLARGETLGAITFAWSRPGRHYSAADMPLMEDLGARAAVAIDNARLYERERATGQQLAFLAEASTTLASSLDVETTLTNVAHLVVPQFADWCAVDVLDEDGALRRLTVAHRDPEKAEAATRSRDEYPPTVDEREGTGRVVRTGQPALYRTITPEYLASTARHPEQLKILNELGMVSAMVVPLKAGGRTVGALQLVSADARRLYDDEDMRFAEHLGRRAAAAVDNALLYRRAEQRAQAAVAITFVGDGVFLVDDDGIIRIWNTAAAVITGLAEADVINRSAEEVIPGWEAIESHVPLALGPGVPRAETVPVELHGGERWLSMSGVAFPGGTVYAFRDLTEERRVERLKSEFVSTISHELRTPLAAIYGAALTLRREEPALEAQRDGLLDVIAGESERLARIVNDILWASRLESGTLHVAVESCDPRKLAATVIEASKAHVPDNVTIELVTAAELPAVAADPDKVRQVLTNLVDNAVKYSPDGGHVSLEVLQRDEAVCFVVTDQGLGIPQAELPRIFEKFYRLDPELTRGVGGTGLGLYITRELVRRMNGRVDVESLEGEGSTFRVELPVAR
jgi:PAS domain S-box-containing protein